MSHLMVSVSGVRGVVGETLTPETIVKFVSAFASFSKGTTVVVGRDSRVSGELSKQIAISTLISHGYKVIDIGVTPTPTVQLMTEHLKADAGLMITASHNPVEWNGLKFIGSDGLFLDPEACKEMYKLADENTFKYKKWDELGSIEHYTSANDDHIQMIFDLDYIDENLIRQKKFKVVLDTINGAGCKIMHDLLRQLGCEIVHINAEAHGIFAHTPEPIPENLSQLMKTVKKENADIGIAVDPDVDRCVLIDENGEALGEEYTLALAVKLVLGKKLGHVVKNMSSSKASDDIAKYYNCLVYESEVGEINVAKKMIEMNAVIGGEGNGGVMLPDLHIGRDAPLAAALTLQHLAEYNGTISALKKTLPEYHIHKEKISIDGIDPEKIFLKIKAKYSGKKISEKDGIKIYDDNWWIHIRKSNTEPILRIISESKTVEKSKELISEIQSLI
jgi:phosphomannomutase